MDEAQVDEKGPVKEEKATRDYKPRPSTPLDLFESSLFLYQQRKFREHPGHKLSQKKGDISSQGIYCLGSGKVTILANKWQRLGICWQQVETIPSPNHPANICFTQFIFSTKKESFGNFSRYLLKYYYNDKSESVVGFW